MSVKNKLYGSFLVVIVLAAGLGIFALRDMGKVNEQGNVISDTNIPRIVHAARLNRIESDYRKYEYMHICSTTPQEMAEVEKFLTEQAKQFDTSIAELEKLASEEKKADVRQARAEWEEYKKLSRDVQALSRENKSAEALALIKGKSADMDKKLSAKLIGYTDLNIKDAEAGALAGNSLYDSSKVVMTAGLAFILLFSVGIAFYISRYIATSLAKMMDFAKTLSAGDFRQTPRAVTSADEFGALADVLVEMRKNVNHLYKLN